MASTTFSGTSSLDKKPSSTALQTRKSSPVPCSIRAHAQDRPAPAAFYELVLNNYVSYFTIISI